mmetsp:Transcript_13433/g.31585  ORF Transcript_13433/g.31585 Transcript_13433/m.31585 type:complete len:215 (-) Transcript_13433:1182-1826(-)
MAGAEDVDASFPLALHFVEGCRRPKLFAGSFHAVPVQARSRSGCKAKTTRAGQMLRLSVHHLVEAFDVAAHIFIGLLDVLEMVLHDAHALLHPPHLYVLARDCDLPDDVAKLTNVDLTSLVCIQGSEDLHWIFCCQQLAKVVPIFVLSRLNLIPRQASIAIDVYALEDVAQLLHHFFLPSKLLHLSHLLAILHGSLHGTVHDDARNQVGQNDAD